MDMLLIDADILLYQSVSAAEKEVEWEPDVWSLTTDLGEAMESFDSKVAALMEQVAPHGIKEYTLCLSDRVNFRKEIYPLYKANRTSRKPVGFVPFRTKLIDTHGDKIVIKKGIEADDCLGIMATKPPVGRTVIWSLDKDLMQIPGAHLVDGEIVTVDKADGDRLHLRQTLTGDSVDNYPGCPGIGPVKADKMLDKDCSWQTVVAAYEAAGLTDWDALVQARLAKILQWEDWNTKKQEVTWWVPPTATA